MRPVHRFRELHDRLAANHPDSIACAKDLAAKVVDAATATVDMSWRALWDKPLYAYSSVTVAQQRIAQLAPEMTGAWSIWGSDPRIFDIRHVRPGVKRDSFDILGGLAQDLTARHTIPVHRLHRIQGAAAALRLRASGSDTPLATLTARQPLATKVDVLRTELGPGWGPVTALHALTDLGQAVKPDRHVVRTMIHLGLFAGDPNKNPNLHESLVINEQVRGLMRELGIKVTPYELRYMDKVLMEFSRRGLLRSEDGLTPIQRSH